VARDRDRTKCGDGINRERIDQNRIDQNRIEQNWR
jgi:hypothetical protein